MKFYHITPNDKAIQKVLIPHIPENTLWEEDIKTNRISICPSIKGCIAGLCINDYIEQNGKMLIYELDVDEKKEDIYSWKLLYEEYGVYDAPLTHEYWTTSKVIPSNVYEKTVSNIKKQDYLLVAPRYKKEITDGLKQKSLFSDEMYEMNVFEISNYCGYTVKEAVKEILTKEDNDHTNSEIYSKIFHTAPMKKNINLYSEYSYITEYELK